MEQEQALNTIVHALLEEPALVEDAEWDTFSVLAALTDEVAELTAYRYGEGRRPQPTPLTATNFDLFRELRQATAAPDGSSWEVCIIKVQRDTGKGSVNFVYHDEAPLWKLGPDTVARIAEDLRPGPADFVA